MSCLRSDAARSKGALIVSVMIVILSVIALSLIAAGLSKGSTVSCNTYTSTCIRETESVRVKLSSGAGGFGVAANVLIILLAFFVVFVGLKDASVCEVAPINALGARLRLMVIVALIVVAVFSLAAAIAVAKSASDKANDKEASQSLRCASCRLNRGGDSCSCSIGGVAIGGAAMDVLVLVIAVVGIVLSIAIQRKDAAAAQTAQ